MDEKDFQNLLIRRLNRVEAALLAVLELQALEHQTANVQIMELLKLAGAASGQADLAGRLQPFDLSPKYREYFDTHLKAVATASDVEVAHLRSQKPVKE